MDPRKLRSLMRQRKLTSAKLEELSQVKKSTIEKISSGQTQNPQYKTVVDLINALDPTVEELFDLLELKISAHPDKDGVLAKFNRLSEHGKELVMLVMDYELNGYITPRDETITLFPLVRANEQEPDVNFIEMDFFPNTAGINLDRIANDQIPKKVVYPIQMVPPNADFIVIIHGDSMEPTFSDGDKVFVQVTELLRIGEIGVFNYMGQELVKELGADCLISHNDQYPPIEISSECYLMGKVLGKLDL